MATDSKPTPTRIAGLDALRGIAALAVFGCHLAAYWPLLGLPKHVLALSQVGAHGVDAFVVLSGFVLTVPYAADSSRDIHARQFWTRRAWRIVPAYWVALAFASSLAMSSMYDHVVAGRASWLDLAPHVVGLQTWFPRTLGTINGSLWSISLELSLYAIFPAVLLLARRTSTLTVAVIAAAICLAWWFAGTRWQIQAGPFQGLVGEEQALPMRLVQFTAGMWLADLLVSKRWIDRTVRRSVLVALATAALVFGVVISTVDAPAGPVIIWWGITGAALIWLFVVFSSQPWMQPLETFGRRSFSFYLVHQPIVLLLSPLASHLPGPWEIRVGLGAIVALGAVAIAAELLFRFVELPSHRLSRGMAHTAATGAPR